ncbi:phosphate ABC transporter substrate-binding protein [Clostridioides mangenotii]|uniref:phosphate ABC transporter substrate-binding protein n=1 Tax=Metaclostridioides mangenotii TaxID=1540 RepID=UPI002149D4D2|nr:phosphate ABC transporter substrate-binding protein [Clostridioides mangenotii]MCR1955638.1 phosphate ABC transporter substrate-binding protein [Clostridioides mangenotii]
MLRNKKFLVLALSLMIGIVSVGCGKGSDKQKSNSDSVTISGSTSVGAVMEPLVEEYKKSEGKKTNLEVQQIGSSSGIKNTIDGTSEIGMTSRDLKDGEKQAKLEETQIAIDGIAVITNKENKVKDLTMEQIKDIYTGKITNWKEVGGEDSPIVVVSREDGSGTREGFETIVGYDAEELTSNSLISDGSGNIKTTVAGNKDSIGYISLGYVDKDVSSVSISGVEATIDNVKNNKYPILRPFLLVNKPDGLSEKGQAFIDYILSEDGQKIVEKHGFVSVK